MANCLVTTLKDAVSDIELLKLGEVKADVSVHPYKSGTTVKFTMYARSSGSYLQIIGNGYFTNADGTANFGKFRDLNVGDNTGYFSDGEYEIILGGKYNISALTLVSLVPANWWDAASMLKGDIADVFAGMKLDYISVGSYYLVGTIKEIDAILDDNVTDINLRSRNGNNPHINGDITDMSLKNSLRNFNIGGLTKVCVPLSSVPSVMPNIENFITAYSGMTTGNLSSISSLQLTSFNIPGNNVEGDISSLSSMTTLTTVNIADCPRITGDTSSLANLTNLTTFTYTNTAITGTWPLV